MSKDAALAERLKRIESRQEELLRGIDDLRAQLGGKGQVARRLGRIERQVAALLRRDAIDAGRLEYPERLLVRRFGLSSQNDEDGMTLALVDAIGEGTRRFAEIGCGVNGGNCGVLGGELGWTGLMVDGREANTAKVRLTFGPTVAVRRAFVTREGIDGLVTDHGLSGDLDVFSIDIDGNDLWVWQALSAARPRLVIAEYNSVFGAERSLAVPYDPKFVRARGPGIRLYYGASLRAFTVVGQAMGYRLVAVEPRGANAYFLRDDQALEIPAVDPVFAFRGAARADYLPELEAVVAARGLALVEL